MINAAPTTPRHLAAAADTEQLTLLPDDSVTPRFRLSHNKRTWPGATSQEEIRRMIAERSEAERADAYPRPAGSMWATTPPGNAEAGGSDEGAPLRHCG